MDKKNREVIVPADKSVSAEITSSNQISPRQVPKYNPGSEAFSIPSISDALRDEIPAKGRAGEANVGNDPKSKTIESDLFTQDQLNHTWKIFVEDINAPQLKSALSSRLPLLKEDFRIIYELDNDLQYQRITLEFKPQLLGFLRQQFRNENIEIEFIIIDNKDFKSDIPYTEREKWQVLTEKYPSLISLKNKFGLDFQ